LTGIVLSITELAGYLSGKKYRDSMKNESTPELLTREETARMLRISLMTLYNWTRSGRLVAYKIGPRQVYYKLEEVMEALHRFTYPYTKS